jgi:hypothetical protein
MRMDTQSTNFVPPRECMITTAQIELDDALIKQLTFKPGAMREAACLIILKLSVAPAYADEIDFTGIGPRDKNCIGGAFRQLKQAGLIQPHDRQFRRSTSKTANGRTVFRWSIVSVRLAKKFLERNGQNPRPLQLNLLSVESKTQKPINERKENEIRSDNRTDGGNARDESGGQRSFQPVHCEQSAGRGQAEGGIGDGGLTGERGHDGLYVYTTRQAG